MFARVFSLKKNSLQYLGNVSIYSVGKDMVEQINQNSKTECFANISQESLTREIVAKTSCHQIVMTFRIPVMCSSRDLLRGKFTREIPVKTTPSSMLA